MRPLLPALLLLASCSLLSSEPVTPETLEESRLIAQAYCSRDVGSKASPLWLCKVYKRGERVFVAYHHLLSGELLAIGEKVGEDSDRVVIRWERPAEVEVKEGKELEV